MGISRAFSTCYTLVSKKASRIPVSRAKEIARIAQNAVASAIHNKKAPLNRAHNSWWHFLCHRVYTHPALRIPKILHYKSSSPVNFIPPTRKSFTSHFYNRMLRLYFQPCHRSVLSKILHQATGYPWMGVFHWCQKHPTVTTKASRLALHPPVSAELIIWKVGKSAWYVAHFWKLCPSNYKQH